MNYYELNKILELHRLWLDAEAGGERADLNCANLEGTILVGAKLTGADLRYANLADADLRYADLTGADLRNTKLTGADLTCANLTGADLRWSKLTGANLTGTNLDDHQVVPKTGSFIAYKKVWHEWTCAVIKIYVPAEAKRCNAIGSRKCRASKVKVLEGEGTSPNMCGKACIHYQEGQWYEADAYNDDIRVECTGGIHFFMTKEEAESY